MNKTQWMRDTDGVLAGVCSGLAKRFQIDVMLMRILWILAVWFGGFGLGIYIILALSLPRADKLDSAGLPKIWGVCVRFAKRFDIDIGLTRAGFALMLLCSVGTFFFVYLLLYFILPNSERLPSDSQG